MYGMTLKKKKETNTRANVPIASMRRNFDVSSGNAKVEMVEKKKALKPNAAKGNAVAVPR